MVDRGADHLVVAASKMSTRHFPFSLALMACILASDGLGAEASVRPPASDPAALVQEFYDRYPHELEGGLPAGEDLEWLSAYISDRLYQQFRSTLEYQQDWIRRNPDDPPYILKPPFADGVDFTGVPDAIDSFVVVGAEPQTPGTWHVRIHFCIDPKAPGWDVLVVVQERRSRYVIDDVIFLPAEPGGVIWTLYQSLDWSE